MTTTSYLINGTEVLVTPANPATAWAEINGKRLFMGGSDPQQIAQMAWKAINPKPSPERIEAMRLADERGEDVCERCGGRGGWHGWPGYTCFECDGRGTVALDPDSLPDPLTVLDRHDVVKQVDAP